MKRMSERRFPFNLTDNRKFFVFWEFAEFGGSLRVKRRKGKGGGNVLGGGGEGT